MKHRTLKTLLIIAPLLSIASCSMPSVWPADPGESGDYAPSGYTLSWSDEFDGESLNLDYWTYETGNGGGGWGNQESQYYTNHNDSLKDGNLIITAKRENTHNKYDFTSTRIKTQGKVKTTYGYICARIKLPAVKGLWPAFWMMHESGWWPYSGEIDIMENKGRDSSRTSSACHYNENGNHSQFNHTVDVGNIEDYHVYSVLWDEESITFSVDGKKHLSRNKTSWNKDYKGTNAPFNQDFYIILNMAVGGTFDNFSLPPEDWESSDMLVDYVRIYQAEE